MLDLHFEAAGSDAGLLVDADEVQQLEARLHRGWKIIETRESQGKPVDHLIDHFLGLLRDYETAYRHSQAA
jgi:hypothetical protein